MSKPLILQTPEIAELLRANRFTLNRLMRNCEIKPIYGGRGRGKVFLFDASGVATFALAYWLFRSGLRTSATKDALASEQLKLLCQSLTSIEELEGAGDEFLVSWRVVKPKKGRKKEKVWQKVRLAKDIAEVQRILKDEKQFGFVVIPIGRLLRELAERIRKSQIRK